MTSTTTPIDRRPWGAIHADFKARIEGHRFVLMLDAATGMTVLTPWIGPK